MEGKGNYSRDKVEEESATKTREKEERRNV